VHNIFADLAATEVVWKGKVKLLLEQLNNRRGEDAKALVVVVKPVEVFRLNDGYFEALLPLHDHPK
jgi:hypothetical protein